MTRFLLLTLAAALLTPALPTAAVAGSGPSEAEVRRRLEDSRKRIDAAWKRMKASSPSRRTASQRGRPLSGSAKTPMRAEYERKSAERKRARDDEAARLRRGPSLAELERAGNPLAAARDYLSAAKIARRPDDLRKHLTKSAWQRYESTVQRFDAVHAAAELRRVAGRTDDKAELVRRIQQDPDDKFVESHNKKGRTLVKVSDPKLSKNNRFELKMTAHLYPPCDPAKLGKHYKLYPFGEITLRLEDGRWKVAQATHSISVTVFKYR